MGVCNYFSWNWTCEQQIGMVPKAAELVCFPSLYTCGLVSYSLVYMEDDEEEKNPMTSKTKYLCKVMLLPIKREAVL